jgi:hypothetical protein
MLLSTCAAVGQALEPDPWIRAIGKKSVGSGYGYLISYVIHSAVVGPGDEKRQKFQLVALPPVPSYILLRKVTLFETFSFKAPNKVIGSVVDL